MFLKSKTDEHKRQINREADRDNHYPSLVSSLVGLYILHFGFIGRNILYRPHTKKDSDRREQAKTKERELAQAKEIEKAYTELKATQSQLIQSEKMASLGELTAGIAHEIQNPLNFINNFYEVNKELIREMKTGIRFTEIMQDAISTIADNV